MPVPVIHRLTIITGHYGCGKTNLSLNLALDTAATGEPVTLVDLDIVNPYFRSSDHTALLQRRGVRVVAPVFAGTTLETPSLSGAIDAALGAPGTVIVDVGGDDAGATALGRFSEHVDRLGYDLLYVINRYRNLTATPQQAAALLSEIEAASHLRATGVVDNPHLREETGVDTVLASRDFARETAALLGLPLRFTTVPAALDHDFSADSGAASHVENKYPVRTYVHTPWEESPGVDEEE